MKKLFIVVLTICFGSQINAQDVAGSWVGILPIGGVNLHLGFNIKKISDTSYSSTFDSPDQKVLNYPCSKTYSKKDSIFIAVGNIKYAALWDGKGSLNGLFKQGAMVMQLNMKAISAAGRTALINGPTRPQTPKPPYGYHSEDVEYDNSDKSLHYGATFTRPEGNGQFPAVIIISGSGTQDRDGTMLGHKFYWVLADYLTKHGIAVLRVDDRGAGKSSLGNNIKTVTSVDFSYDVEASLNYLETRTDVDKKHLGLIGHSEGGIIAPMVAARRRDVSFIVMWGAPEAGGKLANIEQNAHLLKTQGVDSVAVNAFIQLHKQILDLLASSATQQIFDEKSLQVFASWKQAQSQKILAGLNVNGNNIFGQDLLTGYNALYNMPWMRFFIAYNPENDLSKVKCSVLAVNGAKDTQVNASENLTAITRVLRTSGNRDFKTIEIPNTNHFLQSAATGNASEYETTEETMSPVAMNIISSWIKLHTR